MKRKFKFIIILALCMIFCAVIYAAYYYVSTYSFHFEYIEHEQTESADFLRNPDRGFYNLCGIVLSDEPQDYETVCKQRLTKEINEQDQVGEGTRELTVNDLTLAQVQINLRNYSNGPLSERALRNLDAFFAELSKYDKHYIVRFLYDWDGNAKEAEPRERAIIENHMTQLSEILHKYERIIFTLHGVFTGNWGEMCYSNYGSDDDIRALTNVLLESAGENTFLAVRMPMHWRQITESSDPNPTIRLGLFNDGMLGSYSDLGTYISDGSKEKNPLWIWNRDEELEFQNELCKYVPNGGEIVLDNEYNDFDNALRDLPIMHVSYVNIDYDRHVYDKWENETVDVNTTVNGLANVADCYIGMNGFDFIERHMGYRFFLNRAEAIFDFRENMVSLSVYLQNVGFAPAYSKYLVQIVLRDADGNDVCIYDLSSDVRLLSGGTDAEELMSMEVNVSLKELQPESVYRLYFRMMTEDGKMILLSNKTSDNADSSVSVFEMDAETIQNGEVLLGKFCFDRFEINEGIEGIAKLLR